MENLHKYFLRLTLFIMISLIMQFSYAESEWKQDLVSAAQIAQAKSYSPYSNYKVGAAIRTKSGKIISGTNVENASYGLTNCAERSAVFAAISQGDHDLDAIAIVTQDGGFPCGACRQILNEFNPRTLVIIANNQGNIITEVLLANLLPNAFGPENLVANN